MIEALIVAATLSLVFGAIFGIAYRAQVSFDAEKRFTETSQHARVAMDEIVRYIRQAGNDPFPKDGFSYLAVQREADGNQITVRSDITGSYPAPGGLTGDPDQRLRSPMEDVTIQYLPNYNPMNGTGAVLIRDNNSALAAQVLADNITVPAGETFFKFYDSAGSLTTDSTKIVSVQITMAARTPTRMGRTNTVTYRSHVFIRSKTFDVFATP